MQAYPLPGTTKTAPLTTAAANTLVSTAAALEPGVYRLLASADGQVAAGQAVVAGDMTLKAGVPETFRLDKPSYVSWLGAAINDNVQITKLA